MKIQDNILKFYLKNCYFITGTAYAGKSTMCSMLSKKYNMLHCEENYNMDTILSVVDEQSQPNLSYFNAMPSWQHYVSRTPKEFYDWYNGVSKEVAGFEIAELIRLSGDRKVIVDTNIPLDILHKIAMPNHVAVMLSPQSMSVAAFFNRSDPEKQFLLKEIEKCPNPKAALENFKACIAAVNSPEVYETYLHSGFFTLIREDTKRDTREEVLQKLAKHFGLNCNIE